MTSQRAIDGFTRTGSHAKRVVDFDLRQPDDGIVQRMKAARRRGNGILLELYPPHFQCGCKSAEHSAGGRGHHVIHRQWQGRQ